MSGRLSYETHRITLECALFWWNVHFLLAFYARESHKQQNKTVAQIKEHIERLSNSLLIECTARATIESHMSLECILLHSPEQNKGRSTENHNKKNNSNQSRSDDDICRADSLQTYGSNGAQNKLDVYDATTNYHQ